MSTREERKWFYDGGHLFADGRFIPLLAAERLVKEDSVDYDSYCFTIPLGETGFVLWLYVRDEVDEENKDWYMLQNEELESRADSALAVRVTDDMIYVSSARARYGTDRVKMLLAEIMEGGNAHWVNDAADFNVHLDKLLSLPFFIDEAAFA